jgi:uncharacterized damage-inducible protein DinB
MASILVTLFEHNRWANLRTTDACAALSDAQWEATVPGTMGSVRKTLLHIAAAEQRYVDRLGTGWDAYFSTSEGAHYVQAINHATEHRSQIFTILTQQGVEPPSVDGRTFGT